MAYFYFVFLKIYERLESGTGNGRGFLNEPDSSKRFLFCAL